MLLLGIVLALLPHMRTIKKEILREAAEICKLSSLYSAFSREEKREAVLHIYHLISGTKTGSGEVLKDARLSVR